MEAQTAEATARALLLRFLRPEQQEQLRKTSVEFGYPAGYFEEIAPSGLVYRFCAGSHRNVSIFTDAKGPYTAQDPYFVREEPSNLLASACVVVTGQRVYTTNDNMPSSDETLTMLLNLRADERKFWDTAAKSMLGMGVYQHYRKVGRERPLYYSDHRRASYSIGPDGICAFCKERLWVPKAKYVPWVPFEERVGVTMEEGGLAYRLKERFRLLSER